MSSYRVTPPLIKISRLAAEQLNCGPAQVFLEPLANSNANYVFRARSSLRSVIVKWSNNVSPSIGWPMDPLHLYHEYEFLRNIHSFTSKVRLPQPLAYEPHINAVVMSDLGSNGVALTNLAIDYTSDSRPYYLLGRFLASVHHHPYNTDFKISLLRNNFYKSICKFKFMGFNQSQSDYQCMFTKRRLSVVLMDFSPRNVICFDDYIGVVDFDFVSYGDPLFDLAHFQSYMLWKFIVAGDIEGGFCLASFFDGYNSWPSTYVVLDSASSWLVFCQYFSALLYHRINRAGAPVTAEINKNIISKISTGRFYNWESLTSFLFKEGRWVGQ